MTTAALRRRWLAFLLLAVAAAAMVWLLAGDALDGDAPTRSEPAASPRTPPPSTPDAGADAPSAAGSTPAREVQPEVAAAPNAAAEAPMLRGRVTQGRGPTSRVNVRLYRHVERDADAGAVLLGDAYAVRRANSFTSGWTTTTALDGSFQFKRTEPGRYDVSVLKGPTVFATIAGVELMLGATHDVTIDLPPEGGIRGRLVGPSSTNLNELRVRVVPTALANDVVLDDPTATPAGRAFPDAFGWFIASGVRAGPATVWLELPNRPVNESSAPLAVLNGFAPFLAIDVATIDVKANAVLDVEIDVSRHLPGRLSVTVEGEASGVRSLDLVLQVERLGGSPAPDVAVPLGRRDRADVGPLAPGDWRVALVDGGGSWMPWPPTVITIVPCVTTRLAITPPLATPAPASKDP